MEEEEEEGKSNSTVKTHTHTHIISEHVSLQQQLHEGVWGPATQVLLPQISGDWRPNAVGVLSIIAILALRPVARYPRPVCPH